MRIRLNELRRSLRRKKAKQPGEKFAWTPKRLDNGTVVWLETFTRYKKYGVKQEGNG